MKKLNLLLHLLLPIVVKIPWSGYWVMSTYIAAQVLIMLGLLAEANHEPSNEK